MKAMILAAGRGERMRPLTDTLPKPLLPVLGKPLIVYHLEKLAAAGVHDVIINIAYLGEKIRQALGDGSRWGLSIHYSEEQQPLETGGALLHALPLLGEDDFLLINGDVWTDLEFSLLIEKPLFQMQGCLVFVDNPSHNLNGDYIINKGNKVEESLSQPGVTFSGLARINPKMITDYPYKRDIFPLREVFDYYVEKQQLEGIVFQGEWHDIGTPERLMQLETLLSAS